MSNRSVSVLFLAVVASCGDSNPVATQPDAAVQPQPDAQSDAAVDAPVDECTTGVADCVDATAGGTCTDTAGGFTCGCAAGYSGDGLATGTGCTDVDECAADANACGYAACTNTAGSFACTVIYASSPFQNMGWVIHPTTLEVIGSFQSELANRTVSGLSAVAVDPTTGTKYALAKASGATGRLLVTITYQPGVASLTEIGDLGDKFASIAFREDGQLFGVTGDGATVPETLYTIDKATAVATLATALGNGGDGEALVYNPDDDHFYHFSGNGTVVFEKVASQSPYTVTNIPIVGTPNGETFGAYYLGNSQILISNISSSFNIIGTDGTWGAQAGAFPDDLRAVDVATVSPNAFRVTPSAVSTAGGETVTITGSFAAPVNALSMAGTPVTGATFASGQITFPTSATTAGTELLTVSGGTSSTQHVGEVTFVDAMQRRIGSGSNESMQADDSASCSTGTSQGLGALVVIGVAVLVPRRRRRA